MIRIAVVGPESTGKSIMAGALAEHFGTVCVPEYAREYCGGLDRQYTLQDELNIFHGQLALERSLMPQAKNGLLFSDTMILTIKVWCDYLFGETPASVSEAVREADYDFYLLMDIDLPWEDDPLRDFPDQREHFMGVWHRELQAIDAWYAVVSGSGQERFENGLKAVTDFLSSTRIPQA